IRTTPTSSSQVLGGKLFGVYLTGVAQLVILSSASALLFRIDWGRPLDVFLLVLAVVAGAAGWGTLLAAISKTPTQASSMGMALMLAFGILGDILPSIGPLLVMGAILFAIAVVLFRRRGLGRG